LHDHPEFFSRGCHGSRDLSPVVFLPEQNSHLLDRRVVAFAMKLLHDFCEPLVEAAPCVALKRPHERYDILLESKHILAGTFSRLNVSLCSILWIN
jgi:hypothetical protein